MADRANVRSIDAIGDCRATLIKYIDAIRIAIGETRSDVLRVQRWVGETKKHEWTARGKKCTQLLANARSDLERAKIARPDAHPSMFTDQLRALDKAKRNVTECEHKLKMIARWSRELERERMLFQGGMQRLARIIDGDLTTATAWMSNLMDHLNNYVQTSAPKLPRAEAADMKTTTARRHGGGHPEQISEGEHDEPAINPSETTTPDQGPDDAVESNE